MSSWLLHSRLVEFWQYVKNLWTKVPIENLIVPISELRPFTWFTENLYHEPGQTLEFTGKEVGVVLKVRHSLSMSLDITFVVPKPIIQVYQSLESKR